MCIFRWLPSPPKLPSLTLFGTTDFFSFAGASPSSAGGWDLSFPNADLISDIREDGFLESVPRMRGRLIVDVVVVVESKEARGDVLGIFSFFWKE